MKIAATHGSKSGGLPCPRVGCCSHVSRSHAAAGRRGRRRRFAAPRPPAAIRDARDQVVLSSSSTPFSIVEANEAVAQLADANDPAAVESETQGAADDDGLGLVDAALQEPTSDETDKSQFTTFTPTTPVERSEGAQKPPSQWQGDFGRNIQKLKEWLFFTTPIPVIGNARMSYSRFLHLLRNRMIKRVTILGCGQLALVEVPIFQGGHDYETQRYCNGDYSKLYLKEQPEWRMEMLRFCVELPGDFWWNSDFTDMMWAGLPHKRGDGFVHRSWLNEASQYHLEVRALPPGEGYQWAAAYADQLLLVGGLVAFRVLIGWIEAALDKLNMLRGTGLSERARLFKEMSQNISTAYNLGSGPSTGVRFEDVQGIDAIRDDIIEVLKMLVGSEAYQQVGAHVPRGVLLEGPPGTGKTFLARAMANEAGIPFFAANGAEFVQLYSGIACARVQTLFQDARKVAPSIIFIDEIDAIGKARDATGRRDSSSAERESGLLQLLVEMDGFKPTEQVLVIGATNRRSVLDPALLRPGRFDRTIYMGTPNEENRYRILAVHARGKQVPREDEDALLREVARRTVGYSGAELANLLNESAILQVRYAKPAVDLPICQEVMDKTRIGIATDSLPLSTAKRHLAVVWAGRAVLAAAVGPQGPPGTAATVDAVSLTAVGDVLGRLLYVPGSGWATGREGKGDFAFCVDLLVALYAARATEEVFYGLAGTTLSTTGETAMASQLARWLCVHSTIHPALRRVYVKLDEVTPLTQYVPERPFEELCIRILTLALHRALRLVHERRNVIDTVAQELLDSEDELVPGARIYELLEQPPLPVAQEVLDGLPFKHFMPEHADEGMMVDEKALLKAVNLVRGDVDPGIFFDAQALADISAAFSGQSEDWKAQQAEKRAFVEDEAAAFPSRPDLKDKMPMG